MRRISSILAALLAAVALSLWPIAPASAAMGVLTITDVDLEDGDTEAIVVTNPDNGECIDVDGDDDGKDHDDTYTIANLTDADVEVYDQDNCQGNVTDTVEAGETDTDVDDPYSVEVGG